jgi:arylsulfatase A-like enzyme
MNPRGRALFWLAATLAGILAAGEPTVTRAQDAAVASESVRRPNIVFMLVDDLDYRSMRHMPRVRQRLGREGVTFTRAYTQYALCGPSRATLLTGRYAQNTGVRKNLDSYRIFHGRGLEHDTVAVWLQRAGYRTALIGKYINAYPTGAARNHVPPGWDRWAAVNTSNQYDYAVNEDGRWVRYGSRPADYATDVQVGKARGFVRDSLAEGRPFALFLWFSAVHAPLQPALRHAGLFPDAGVPRLPSYDEADKSDKPPFLRLPPLPGDMAASLDGSYRDRRRMLQAVDEGVASLHALLRSKGALQNTYIVFTSDNGFQLGEHGLKREKATAYEEAIHVPLLVRGPNVPAGRRIGRLIGNADLAPTFAEWAGIEPPAHVDGRSFARLLRAPEATAWRDAVPLSRLPEGQAPAESWRETALQLGKEGYGCIRSRSGGGIPEFRGVRTTRYTFTQYPSGDMELYDNIADPYQLENIVCSAPARLRHALSRLAARLSDCAGRACRRLDAAEVP